MVRGGLAELVPTPDVALAQHVLAYPSGTVGTHPGPFLSTAASMRVTLHGRGSHGSMPQLSVDPVVLAAMIVVRLQGIVAREVAPDDFAVLTVGRIAAGTKSNIIPDDAVIDLNLRAYDETIRTLLIDAVTRVVKGECAASGSPKEPEFELYGLDKSTQVSRFEESIELVLKAWSGEDIDHDGKHFQVKGTKITPSPVSPELWLGAMSEPGVRRAAKFGLTWCTDPLHNLDVMKHWAGQYRDFGKEFGTEGKQNVVLLRDGWVGDDLDEVERVWWPAIRSEHWFYFSQVPRWVADREPFLQGIEKEEDFLFDNHRKDRLIVGSPQD